MSSPSSSSSSTTFTDLHNLFIQTQILPKLDGQSLSSIATASSHLRALCSDDILWSDICKSNWPSITHPRVRHLISTFPSGHRSFFQDSFHPFSSTSQPEYSSLRRHHHHHPFPNELISAVDIRYHGDIIYSRAEFTDTTTDFMSSPLKIVLNEDTGVNGMPQSIDLKVDEELLHADDATISHLKESVTLNWILIDPTRKRAVNLSSIKPVIAWITTNDIHLRYAVVLPGCESNETVECRIEVTLGVGKGGVALHVREVKLHLQDETCNCLSGKDFLVITGRAFLGKYNIRDRVAAAVVEVGSNQSQLVKKEEMGKSWLEYNYVMPKLMTFLFCLCFFNILL